MLSAALTACAACPPVDRNSSNGPTLAVFLSPISCGAVVLAGPCQTDPGLGSIDCNIATGEALFLYTPSLPPYNIASYPCLALRRIEQSYARMADSALPPPSAFLKAAVLVAKEGDGENFDGKDSNVSKVRNYSQIQ